MLLGNATQFVSEGVQCKWNNYSPTALSTVTLIWALIYKKSALVPQSSFSPDILSWPLPLHSPAMNHGSTSQTNRFLFIQYI